MNRTGFLALVTLWAGSWITVAASRADDPPPAVKPTVAPASRDIEHWISDLNAAEFARRERATAQLIVTGPAVGNALVAAAKEAGPEASARIVTILRAWYTSEENAAIDAAELALEQLTESKNRHVARRVDAILRQYAESVGEPRALEKALKFGAKRIDRPTTTRFRGAFAEETKGFGLMVGEDWKGGADGFKLLRRMPNLMTLFLAGDRVTGTYKTPGVTQELVDDLRKAHPSLAIDFRGRAYLGVTAGVHLLGCQLDVVAPNSPAQRAKLTTYDVLATFDGKPVKDFNQLVDLIATKQPGDVVKAEVLRGDLTELEQLVRLGREDDADKIKQLRKEVTIAVEIKLAEWGVP